MKAKLLVLIVAAACAIASATASRAAAPKIDVPPMTADPVAQIDGGWWDWHGLDK